MQVQVSVTSVSAQ